MKCNKCNSDIDKYSKFCPNCGNEIIKKEDDIMYRMKKNFYKFKYEDFNVISSLVWYYLLHC